MKNSATPNPKTKSNKLKSSKPKSSKPTKSKNESAKPRARASSAQEFVHSMPAGCNYNHLSTIAKPLDPTFLKDGNVIQKKFSVRISSKQEWPNFSDARLNIREMTNKEFFMVQNWYPFWQIWPNVRLGPTSLARDNNRDNNVLARKRNMRLSALDPNKLYVVFILAVPGDGVAHASAGIVHKHGNQIEYFILDPHGKAYDFHYQVAERYFQPDVVYMPFAQVQGKNTICSAHSKALLFRFLKNYKVYGNRALEQFRGHAVIGFSRPPILNATGPLSRMKTFRTIQSIRNTKNTKGKAKRSSILRSRIEPSNTSNRRAVSTSRSESRGVTPRGQWNFTISRFKEKRD
tara:strand:+ start:1086 stop:2126 length:1041 start_codon:yes stop_codon:yes gene_type:complete